MVTPYIVEKNGKRYMYRATSHYSKGKRGPVAETEYMGVVIDGKLKPKRGYHYDEDTGDFGPIETPQAKGKAPTRLVNKRYGDTYLLMALQKRLNILEDLEAAFGKEDAAIIMAAVLAYTVQPSAHIHLGSVMERRCILEMLHLPLDIDLSGPRLSDLIRYIGTAHDSMDEFFRRRISSADKGLVFDLTLGSTSGPRDADADWGMNWYGGPGRMNLGFVTDRHGRPLMFGPYPRSAIGVTGLEGVLNDAIRLGGKDCTLVMDRPLRSLRGVVHLLENGADFVMPMMAGDNPLIGSMITDLTSKVGNVEHLRVHGNRSYTVDVRRLGIRRCGAVGSEGRDTVWEDPDGYDLLLDVDHEFGSCEYVLDVYLFRDVESAGAGIARMDVALDSIMRDVGCRKVRDPAKAFSRVADGYEGLLELTVDENGMHASIRQDAYTFSSNRKGVSVIIAPASDERRWDDVLGCYECRGRVEDVILRDLSEGSGRSPRSGDRDTTVGMTFIRMVSSILMMEMANRISEVSKDRTIEDRLKSCDMGARSPSSLLDSLSNIGLIVGDGWSQLTEPTEDCLSIYDMFDIRPPNLTDCP